MKIRVYVIDVKLPRWLRRALVFGAVPVVLLGLGALVFAEAVTGQRDFNVGQILTARTLNEHLGALQNQINTLSISVPYAVQAGHAAVADSATNATNVTGALTTGMFRVSTSCTTDSANASSTDCVCASGEIAITGGGWAGGGGAALVESAHIVTGSGRDLSGWRVECIDGGNAAIPCGNAYVLCVKVLQ